MSYKTMSRSIQRLFRYWKHGQPRVLDRAEAHWRMSDYDSNAGTVPDRSGYGHDLYAHPLTEDTDR